MNIAKTHFIESGPWSTSLSQIILPAHLIKEAVSLGHAVQLMLVLLQEIHVTLLWDKLQQLDRNRTIIKRDLYSHTLIPFSPL